MKSEKAKRYLYFVSYSRKKKIKSAALWFHKKIMTKEQLEIAEEAIEKRCGITGAHIVSFQLLRRRRNIKT